MIQRAAVASSLSTFDSTSNTTSSNSCTVGNQTPPEKARASGGAADGSLGRSSCTLSQRNCVPSQCSLASPSCELKITGDYDGSAVSAKAKSSSPDTEEAAIKPAKHWSGVQRSRMPHHVVERRYRDNLNERIDALRLSIPSLANQAGASDVEDAITTKLPSKANVIAAALDYVKNLEEERTQLMNETIALREQVAKLQKLVRCDDCSVIEYFNSLQLS
jgi:hypothetical protein